MRSNPASKHHPSFEPFRFGGFHRKSTPSVICIGFTLKIREKRVAAIERAKMPTTIAECDQGRRIVRRLKPDRGDPWERWPESLFKESAGTSALSR
jgi:hypothetical protein